MTVYPITLNVPRATYEQIQRAAQKVKRPIDELFVEAIVAAAPALTHTSTSLKVPMAQMAYLNDAALWQAARSTLMPEQRERLAALHETQQRRPLSGEEQAEEQALLKLYREVVLVRAQAAVLLKQRGYDISDLTPFEPGEGTKIVLNQRVIDFGEVL